MQDGVFNQTLEKEHARADWIAHIAALHALQKIVIFIRDTKHRAAKRGTCLNRSKTEHAHIDVRMTMICRAVIGLGTILYIYIYIYIYIYA